VEEAAEGAAGGSVFADLIQYLQKHSVATTPSVEIVAQIDQLTEKWKAQGNWRPILNYYLGVELATANRTEDAIERFKASVLEAKGSGIIPSNLAVRRLYDHGDNPANASGQHFQHRLVRRPTRVADDGAKP
ncbi:MAG: hypothetical protein KDA61_18450, partial [Planctomycetales bacterium]|nr:hypothetical protein [Planctomycetales bacterium]